MKKSALTITNTITNKPNMNRNLRAALDYAKRGFACFPVHGIRNGVCTCPKGARCPVPGKHPATDHGVKDATTDHKTIKRLFKDLPAANVGVATGAASGIIVLDIDPRNDGMNSLSALEAKLGPFPPTLSVETGGGGRHLFFKAPKAAVRTAHGKALGKGIDLQSDGAYVVVPPSRHASGKRYRWETEDGNSAPIAELPAKLRQLLVKPKPKTIAVSTPPATTSSVGVGNRNTQLTSVGGLLVRNGMKGGPLFAALKATNAALDPPLDDDEVKKIATSVERYDPNQPGDEAEKLATALLEDRFSLNGQSLLIHASDGQFWRFESTHWRPAPTKWLQGQVLEFMKAWPGRKGTNTSALIRQAISLLEALTASDKDLLRFTGDSPPVINCLNGELWIGKDGTVALQPHRASSFLRHVLPVKYDPTAACPKFDKAIAEIFCNAPHPKEMIAFWYELSGYAIQTSRKIPLIVICKGGGSNGKTALIQTLIQLIGRDLVAAMPVGDLDTSRFTVGSLLGKQLFVDDDVKTGTKLPDGQLKRLSEAKTITGETKFGPPFNFIVRTLPIMLCNNPPSLSDLSHGFTRRLAVVPFDRTFSKSETDKELFPAIWASEMSGVLNRALAGLARVVKMGWNLSTPKAMEVAKSRWMIDANPLPAFIDACCEETGKSYVEDLYQAYLDWARSSGITMHQQRTSFDRNLESSGYRFGIKGSRGKKILGLSLKKRLP